jgi:hypothetical protein
MANVANHCCAMISIVEHWVNRNDLEFRPMTPKDSSIGFRVSGEVKEALEQIAKKEGRSLAQVCDLILRGGINDYEKEGAAYLHRLLAQAAPKKPPKRS